MAASISLQLFLQGGSKAEATISVSDDWKPKPGDFVVAADSRCFRVLARVFLRRDKVLLVEECPAPIELPHSAAEKQKELDALKELSRSRSKGS